MLYLGLGSHSNSPLPMQDTLPYKLWRRILKESRLISYKRPLAWKRVGSGVSSPDLSIGNEDLSCMGLTRAINITQSCP